MTPGERGTPARVRVESGGPADPVEREAASRERAAEVAAGHVPADLVLTGARLVDVHTRRIRDAGVAVAGDRIAAVGGVGYAIGDRTERFDCGGHYLLPGLIEPHFHVGSSQVTIERLAELLVPKGTLVLGTCFYEPALIGGLAAVRSLTERSAGTGLEVLLSPFYGASVRGDGSNLGMSHDEFLELLGDERCVELREWGLPVTGLPGAPEVWREALRRNLVVAGHLEGQRGRLLSASLALGCCSDHEVATAAEAIEKVEGGAIVQIREGSGAKDLRNVLPALTEAGLDAGRFALSTDEQELDSLADDGHLDHKLRLAVSEGLGPVDAVRMATLGAARSMGIERNYGSVTPGRKASLVLVEDLSSFRVAHSLSEGRWAAADGRYLLARDAAPYPDEWRRTVRLPRPVTAEDFALPAYDGAVRVIGATPGSLLTEELVEPPGSAGLAKLALVDRHEGSGRIGVGLIRGLDISGGAVAATPNPGLSNLMVLGDDDAAMAQAANRVAELDGGIAVAAGGDIVAELALPIFGIHSDAPLAETTEGMRAVTHALRERLGCPHDGVLTNAGFACLAASIPLLKLSDRGLFRVRREAPPEPVELAAGEAA